MDPNATLRALAEALEDGDEFGQREYQYILASWIARGGFAPDWDAYPEAARFFREGSI